VIFSPGASRILTAESLPSAIVLPARPAVEPIPPRYWWLKRISGLSLVILVALAGLRVWWGWDAHRRLQAEIDRCIAAGEPIYPADFDPTPIPDAKNAAKVYQDAAFAVSLTTEQTERIRTVSMEPAAASEHLRELSALIQAQGAAWDLVGKARRLEEVDWGVRFRSPAFGALLPNLSDQRVLGRLLCVLGGYHHATGNDREAVDAIRSVLAHSDAIDGHPVLIGHLYAIASRALGLRQLEWMTPNLSVGPEGPPISDQQRRPVCRQQVEALIAMLLDEESLQNAHVRAMWSERMAQLDWVQMIDRGDITLGQMAGGVTALGGRVQECVWTLLFMPAWRTDGLTSLRYMSELASAVRSPDHAAAQVVPPVDGCSQGPTGLLRPFTCMMLPSFDRAILLHYRLLAMQRMAAMALAIRLYELDHGHRPSALAELVPDYLPVVPLDPFADDGTPIRYGREALPPILYSVSGDGEDDRGQYALSPDGSVDADDLDLVFFLNGDRPRPTPKSDDGEHQGGDDEDEEGADPKE